MKSPTASSRPSYRADAAAYARWAGGSLPGEAQSERAARGRQDGAVDPVSWAFDGHGKARANVWEGAFPIRDTGLRFSLGVSVLVLIAAEQINTSAGLGYLLSTAQLYQQVAVILICIAIYASLGLAADLIVRALERLLMPWHAGIAAR
jgi:hypothetical protein